MVLTNGLSNFQHCQNNGTSRCKSVIRTNEPSASADAANCSGNIPQPSPALTAAPQPSAVGTYIVHGSGDHAAKSPADQHVLQRIVNRAEWSWSSIRISNNASGS